MFSIRCFKRAVSASRTLVTGSGSGSSSSFGSEGSSSDTTFKPGLVVVGLAVIALLILIFWWKKKLERRITLGEVDVSEEKEELQPRLWDVRISSDRRGLEGRSWRAIQPLSVSEQPSLPTVSSSPVSRTCTVRRMHRPTKTLSAQQRRSAHSDSGHSAEAVVVSVIIAMPSQSRMPSHSKAALSSGGLQQVGASREFFISDDMEEKNLEYTFGVAHVPYTAGVGRGPSC